MLVPFGMYQHVEDLALGIDGAPQVHLLTPDAHEHLVEVPAPMRGRAVRPQPACDQRAEGEDPAPDGLVG